MNIEKEKEIIQEWNKCEELVIRENSDYDKTIYIQRKEAMETLLSELEKKDKIIDEMARIMQQILVSTEFIKKQWWKRICKCRKDSDLVKCSDKICEDCVKQYFIKKVEDKQYEN